MVTKYDNKELFLDYKYKLFRNKKLGFGSFGQVYLGQNIMNKSYNAIKVEKISNTQGTYHDFQREVYDERALHDLTLRIPPFDDVISTQNEHIIGKAQDSLRFIKRVPHHKLLYLDPPYNFRQYTSYYFMFWIYLWCWIFYQVFPL